MEDIEEEAEYDAAADAYEEILDTRMCKLHAFSGNEALQSGNF